MKLILPLQSLLALDFPATENICSRVRACFDDMDAEFRQEVLRYVHKSNFEYAEPVLPFFTITRRVVTEITRMMCEVQGLDFNGLGDYNEETCYPAIESGLEHNRVEFGQFYVYPDPDPYAEPHMVPSRYISLNRTAMIQYLIDNGQTVLTVEI